MAGQKKEARGRRKERGKGADRWGRSAAREKERGRATRVKPSRPQRRAVARSGPQRSSSWAAESVRARGWPAGPRGVRASAGKKQRAQASRPRGAVAGRPPGQAAEAGQRGKKKRKRGWAGSVGPKWKKMNFSKSNHFPNLFPLFLRFKSNSNVI